MPGIPERQLLLLDWDLHHLRFLNYQLGTEVHELLNERIGQLTGRPSGLEPARQLAQVVMADFLEEQAEVFGNWAEMPLADLKNLVHDMMGRVGGAVAPGISSMSERVIEWSDRSL